uniref:Uncharacterized protein n=1 Tax=Timema genevievae TaxID=629358 RepID=A0A7R9K627_TIMGE|nr:unnamed protein product [Timema genevievae]
MRQLKPLIGSKSSLALFRTSCLHRSCSNSCRNTHIFSNEFSFSEIGKFSQIYWLDQIVSDGRCICKLKVLSSLWPVPGFPLIPTCHRDYY